MYWNGKVIQVSQTKVIEKKKLKSKLKVGLTLQIGSVFTGEI